MPAKLLNIEGALKTLGGAVQYFDHKHSLSELCAMIGPKSRRNILVCCAGGDAALTMLGAFPVTGHVVAVDNVAGQLFIAAAKARILSERRNPPYFPSFTEIQQLYPDRAYLMPEHLKRMDRLYDMIKNRHLAAPEELKKRYVVSVDDQAYEDPRGPGEGLFWKSDKVFVQRIKKNLHRLRFLYSDIRHVDLRLKAMKFDLIYLDDVHVDIPKVYKREQVKGLLSLLSSKGCIAGKVRISKREWPSNDCSAIEDIAALASQLGLEQCADPSKTYKMFRKIRK